MKKGEGAVASFPLIVVVELEIHTYIIGSAERNSGDRPELTSLLPAKPTGNQKARAQQDHTGWLWNS